MARRRPLWSITCHTPWKSSRHQFYRLLLQIRRQYPDSRYESLYICASLLLCNCPPLWSPGSLISDNATNFTAQQIKELCSALETYKVYVTPYHSQSNGAVERTFRTWQDIIAKLTFSAEANGNDNQWDIKLANAAYVYNTSVHSAHGQTPYFVFFARDPTLPIEAMLNRENIPPNLTPDYTSYKEKLVRQTLEAQRLVSDALQKDALKMKERYNAKVSPNEFHLGDTVTFKRYTLTPGTTPKFAPHWLGTYRIIELDSNASHATIQPLSDSFGKTRTVCLDQIKHHIAPTGRLHITRRNSDSEVQEIDEPPTPETDTPQPIQQNNQQSLDPDPTDNDFYDPDLILAPPKPPQWKNSPDASPSDQPSAPKPDEIPTTPTPKRRRFCPLPPRPKPKRADTRHSIPSSHPRKIPNQRPLPYIPPHRRNNQPNHQAPPQPYVTRTGRQIQRPRRYQD